MIDDIGVGVNEGRLGQKVWCYGAQSYRPFGTAAEYCVVPSGLAVLLPDTADAELLDQPTQVRKVAPDGVHSIAEIDFAGHIDLGAAIIAIGATISSYYSTQNRPSLPYWPLGFADTTLRLLGSDDFAPEVKAHAANELTGALLDGTLRIPIAERLPLDGIAIAHEYVELGTRGRVLLYV